ncbi:MAG: Type II secretory pathway component [Gammaproteobacteria bacterium]|nr:Type II secretory pathway component [Gammaproteobacteria bacterium]
MSRIAFLILLLAPFLAFAIEDPMRPPQAARAVTSARSVASFKLSSTFIARDERRAVINGKTVRVGDVIAGARVDAIEPALVRLRRGGSEVVVRLLPTRVKQSATEKQEQE